MTLTLPSYDIGTAVIEYLERRGIQAKREQLSITYKREEDKFYVIVSDLELPPKEGVYR